MVWNAVLGRCKCEIMNKIKKQIIKFLIVHLIFLANLLTYAFVFKAIGNEESNGYMLWAVSNYLTLFLAIAFFEKVLKNLIIKKKLLVDILFIIFYILVFCFGFAFSTIEFNSAIFYIVLSAQVLLNGLIIGCLIYLTKKAEWKEENLSAIFENEETDEKITFDIYRLYTDKYIDEKTKEKAKISVALALYVCVYISIILCFGFVSAFADNVKVWHIVVACILFITANVCNFYKIKNMPLKNKGIYFIENGLLSLSMLLHTLITWLVLTVDINFILLFVCFMLLMPIYLTNYKLAVLQNKNYN